MKQIGELYNFNYWARDRQLAACSVLGKDELTRPIGNEFTSIRETLFHLWGAEWIWLERFSGRNPKALPDWPPEDETLGRLVSHWNDVEVGMRIYLGSIPAGALVDPFTYKDTKGVELQVALWRLLIGLVNNQTYHRGQITTMLRRLGELPPEIDFLAYLNEASDGKSEARVLMACQS